MKMTVVMHQFLLTTSFGTHFVTSGIRKTQSVTFYHYLVNINTSALRKHILIKNYTFFVVKVTCLVKINRFYFYMKLRFKNIPFWSDRVKPTCIFLGWTRPGTKFEERAGPGRPNFSVIGLGLVGREIWLARTLIIHSEI